MCEQCVTEMLLLEVPEESAGFYFGLSRKDWGDDFKEGDLMIGRCNGPDFVYSGDLFTTAECLEYLDAEDEDESSPVDRWYDAQMEGTSIFCEDDVDYAAWVASKFCASFGFPHEEINRFGLHVLATAGDLLSAAGVPLETDARKAWALQFPIEPGKKIDSVRCENLDKGLYVLSYYAPDPTMSDPNEFGWVQKEMEWVAGTSVEIP